MPLSYLLYKRVEGMVRGIVRVASNSALTNPIYSGGGLPYTGHNGGTDARRPSITTLDMPIRYLVEGRRRRGEGET